MPAAGPAPERTLDMLHALDRPFVLFLDDVEAVRGGASAALIREIAASLSPQGRLVIASRTVPPVSVARLRASGQLLELGQTELQFSADDTEDFLLRSRALELDRVQLSQVHATTEGWPVGCASPRSRSSGRAPRWQSSGWRRSAAASANISQRR